jgi:predicted CXXCH cytochrome family protein
MSTSRWLLPVFGLILLGACTNEKIVFKTREPFNPPPDSVNGFLGYFTVGTKQTTCGNCHVGVQTNWAATKHADAWVDLQASGHASSSCYGCHAVSERGNNVGHPAGYSVKADTAYQDVQCENCHGPGFTHVKNPSLTNRPLASIEVDTGKANGCGGCHTGTHEPFVDQWIQSAHGSGPGYAVAAGNATCAPCHEGKTALAVKFNVQTNYVERDSAKTERIVCVVCHDPHGGPNAGQLRASISTPSIDNLCVRCHSRSGVPPWGVAAPGGTARGAHGAQGLLVLGQNVGWFPPNFAYDTTLIVSSHGTEANPRLCATCHVARTTITASNGGFVFQSVGHLFEAVPCTDSTGVPIPGNCAVTQRDFGACATSGCHATPTAARSAFITVQTNIDNLLDQLWVDVNGNSTIDAGDTLVGGTPAGLLPAMVIRGTAADTAALNFGTNVTTTAKGALWNAALAATDDRQYFLGGKVFGRTFATHMASGNGVHNPFLLQSLLSASISAVRTDYGLPAPPHFDTTVRATIPPGVRVRSLYEHLSSR